MIHTVGPVWRGGNRHERALLASCYRRSLELAVENGVTSIAFPSIGTGADAFPQELAAPVAVETVKDFPFTGSGLSNVIFCGFSADDLKRYRSLLRRVTGPAT